MHRRKPQVKKQRIQIDDSSQSLKRVMGSSVSATISGVNHVQYRMVEIKPNLNIAHLSELEVGFNFYSSAHMHTLFVKVTYIAPSHTSI
jgi:hypothetical protein